jgi:hypothetical protein
METYPENAPDTLLLGGEVLVLDSDVSAPTRANGARVVRWLCRRLRGLSLPSHGYVLLEASERRI